MQQVVKKHQSKFRFVLVGLLNTGIDFGLLFLLTGFGVDKYISNYVSTLVALVFSFFSNRNYTFKSTIEKRKQLAPFTVVTLFSAWILQPLAIWLVLQMSNSPDGPQALFIAKTVAISVSLIFNYTLYSRLIFKN